jgi:hypothetical protein
MSESDKSPPPRRTIAVTIAGALLLLPAAAFAYMAAVFATSGDVQHEFAVALGHPYGFLLPVGVGLAVAVVFGCAGLVTIRRWRGWRIWMGVMAWGLIAVAILNLFASIRPESSTELVVDLAPVAFAVFMLVAKRRERRPDIAAVFDH